MPRHHQRASHTPADMSPSRCGRLDTLSLSRLSISSSEADSISESICSGKHLGNITRVHCCMHDYRYRRSTLDTANCIIIATKRLKLRLSGSARKSQKRFRDTPMFKFQAVLARTQPFLSRSVEKRGDQSRFKCRKMVNYYAIRSSSLANVFRFRTFKEVCLQHLVKHKIVLERKRPIPTCPRSNDISVSCG
jgi:hypothetical protein